MRTKHGEEIKNTIIDRYLNGVSVKELRHQTGMPRSTIYHWIKQHNEQIYAAKNLKVNIRNFHLLENKVARLEGKYK